MCGSRGSTWLVRRPYSARVCRPKYARVAARLRALSRQPVSRLAAIRGLWVVLDDSRRWIAEVANRTAWPLASPVNCMVSFIRYRGQPVCGNRDVIRSAF